MRTRWYLNLAKCGITGQEICTQWYTGAHYTRVWMKIDADSWNPDQSGFLQYQDQFGFLHCVNSCVCVLQNSKTTIADVTNSKRHQRLDEILNIFTCTIQEISKVVCKKTMSETRAFITSLCCMKRMHYSKSMLHKQNYVKFRGHIAWQFFWKQLCWFLRCSVGKIKSRFRPAIGGVYN